MRHSATKQVHRVLRVHALVAGLFASSMTFAYSQAPIVQPRSPGYGAGNPANPANPGQGVPGQPIPGQAVPQNPPVNPQLNPQLNPQAASRVQSQLQQAVREGQEFQMQGPNNGGQVIQQRPFPELTAQEQQTIDQILVIRSERVG